MLGLPTVMFIPFCMGGGVVWEGARTTRPISTRPGSLGIPYERLQCCDKMHHYIYQSFLPSDNGSCVKITPYKTRLGELLAQASNRLYSPAQSLGIWNRHETHQVVCFDLTQYSLSLQVSINPNKNRHRWLLCGGANGLLHFIRLEK